MDAQESEDFDTFLEELSILMDFIKSDMIDEYLQNLSLSIELKKAKYIQRTLELKNEKLQAKIEQSAVGVSQQSSDLGSSLVASSRNQLIQKAQEENSQLHTNITQLEAEIAEARAKVE